jgi:hypothetical protein
MFFEFFCTGQTEKNDNNTPNGHQANYINALAVSVLLFFEPAKPLTLGELFVTLGESFFTLGESFFFLFRLFSM